MRHPTLPDARRRIQAAQIHGEVQRLCTGTSPAGQLEGAVARLHEITTNPMVIGHVLGSFQAYRDRSEAYQPAVDLLRAAAPTRNRRR